MRRVLIDQRGMTVAEILIAIAIIGVGLVALSSAIPIAAYGIQEGNQLSTATFLANQRLEQVRNALWRANPTVVDNVGISASATAAPVSGATVTFPDETAGGNPISGYGNYSRTVRVTDCSVGAGCSSVVNADLRQATVTVSYRPMTGVGMAATAATKSVVLTMYIAKRL